MEPEKQIGKIAWVGLLGLVGLVGLAIWGCATPDLPGQGNYSPVPGPSKWTNGIPAQSLKPKVQSLKSDGPPEPEISNLKLEISKAAPARSYWLAWDYGSTNNIRFELWKSDQVKGPFGYWTNVAEKSVAMPTDRSQQFFILRASNTATRLVSDWSR